MFCPRVIPTLLLKNQGLVKSVRFKNHRYIGDPINAVKLFNDLGADELVFLDITASRENRAILSDFVWRIGDEANMPFSVGGGITTIDQIRTILKSGAEKVVINTAAARNPDFIKESSEKFGSSTIVVSMDVKRNLFGRDHTYICSGEKATKYDPVEYALMMEEYGAGELIVNSIERDGSMEGYDIHLIKHVAQAVRIPVVALGGAGTLGHLKEAIEEGFASAVAAGSMFVYHGPRRAVLINYPERKELQKIFEK